jgi:hypothetical protein
MRLNDILVMILPSLVFKDSITLNQIFLFFVVSLLIIILNNYADRVYEYFFYRHTIKIFNYNPGRLSDENAIYEQLNDFLIDNKLDLKINNYNLTGAFLTIKQLFGKIPKNHFINANHITMYLIHVNVLINQDVTKFYFGSDPKYDSTEIFKRILFKLLN